MKRLVSTFLIAGALCQGTMTANEDYVIIANTNTPIETVNIPDLRSIYLGKKKKLGDGTDVMPVYQTSGSTHKKFLSSVVKKTPGQFRTYWKRAVFAGGRVSFKRVRTEEELVAFVQENEGAIGYVSKDLDLDGVKVLGVAH